MHRRAAIAVSVILLPLLGTAVAVASPDDDSVEEQQAEVEANRQRQDELAAQIGLLESSDLELQAELDALVGEIATQEQAVVDARARIGAVEQRIVELDAAAAAAQARVDERRDLAVERAIAAYVDPRPGRIEVLLGTSDLNDLAVRDVLLQQVASHDRGVLTEFEAAVADLLAREEEATTARADLEQAEREASDALSLLEEARRRQEAVREVLQVRIREFRDEADVLAAEEAALQAIIADRLRPPPTTVPPTTAAPTTTAPPTTVGPPTTGGPGPSTTGAPTTTTTTASTTSTTSPPDPGYGLVWPVSGPVTSPFGPRWGRMHNGIDVGVPTGTPIEAAAAGEVFHSGWMGGYGNVVLIDHFNGLITLYAHQSELAAEEGDRVERGEVVGYAGSTGNSTGPHLHFETRVDGIPRDPLVYLP